MIYWKQTDVFGFPEEGRTVLVWRYSMTCRARLITWGDVPMWEVDATNGDSPDRLPLPHITDWSEENAPLTFRRA